MPTSVRPVRSLNYRPSVSIEEGVARYVRWFQESGEALSTLAG